MKKHTLDTHSNRTHFFTPTKHNYASTTIDLKLSDNDPLLRIPIPLIFDHSIISHTYNTYISRSEQRSKNVSRRKKRKM